MSNLIKNIIDSCFLAKQITEMLPPLPVGMKPRHIHVIDAVCSLRSSQPSVKVTDISKFMNITTPSVTKLIKELCDLKALEKKIDSVDKRVTLIELTPLGELYYQKHVVDFQNKLLQSFKDIDETDCLCLVMTIKKIHAKMKLCLANDKLTQGEL